MDLSGLQNLSESRLNELKQQQQQWKTLQILAAGIIRIADGKRSP